MLPGFRFLFAAIVLSTSLLVFGLGAATLLRAAHESFASNASWRAPPEVTFAQRRQETTAAVLATLRVDASPTDKANDPARIGAAAAVQAAVPAVQAPVPAEPEAHDPAVASRPMETPAGATAKPDRAPPYVTAAENPPAPEAAPAAEEMVPTETKVAAVTALDTPPSEPATAAQPEPANPTPPTNPAPANFAAANSVTANPAASAPANPATADPTATISTKPVSTTSTSMTDSPVTPEASDATTKIATLGGPPVDITDEATTPATQAAKTAKPDQNAIRKRELARRAAYRREMALLRARLAAQQQFQANPFAPQPLVATPAARRQ
jgi:hypothetical protein